MLRRFAAIALLCLLASPAFAQADAPPIAAPAQDPAAPSVPKPVTAHVSLVTTEGTITIELEKERAPITTANFLRYVAAKRFDGITFYRAMKFGNGGGLVQGGLHNDPKRLFPPIALEPTSRTGLAHVDGTISMARVAPDSATADFFITIGAMPSLDADPKQPGDNLGFAAFGHVVAGMDVTSVAFATAATSPTEGEGVMKGETPRRRADHHRAAGQLRVHFLSPLRGPQSPKKLSSSSTPSGSRRRSGAVRSRRSGWRDSLSRNPPAAPPSRHGPRSAAPRDGALPSGRGECRAERRAARRGC